MLAIMLVVYMVLIAGTVFIMGACYAHAHEDDSVTTMVYVDAIHVHTIPVWAGGCMCSTMLPASTWCTCGSTPISTYTRFGTSGWMLDPRLYVAA